MLPLGSPLTILTLQCALKIACIAVTGSDVGYTLHSLRRGVTQACQEVGLELDAIMKAGMWRNHAKKAYFNMSIVDSAPTALGYLLG